MKKLGRRFTKKAFDAARLQGLKTSREAQNRFWPQASALGFFVSASLLTLAGTAAASRAALTKNEANEITRRGSSEQAPEGAAARSTTAQQDRRATGNSASGSEPTSSGLVSGTRALRWQRRSDGSVAARAVLALTSRFGGAKPHSGDSEISWSAELADETTPPMMEAPESGPITIAAPVPEPSPTASTVPIEITNPATLTFVLSAADFLNPAPPISNAPIELGQLAITAFQDNNLRICGPQGVAKCTQAAITTYTTGVDGPGLWNDDGDYGVPLSAARGAEPLALVGLDTPIDLQTRDIATRNVLRLADWSVAQALGLLGFETPAVDRDTETENALNTPLTYRFQADFTDAGAGTYRTNLVIEYVLRGGGVNY
jgi:hypothetical protein